MGKKKEVQVFSSKWEIYSLDQIIEVKTESDARKRFRNLISGDSNVWAYLYRKDFDENGKEIGSYMLA